MAYCKPGMAPVDLHNLVDQHRVYGKVTGHHFLQHLTCLFIFCLI